MIFSPFVLLSSTSYDPVKVNDKEIENAKTTRITAITFFVLAIIFFVIIFSVTIFGLHFNKHNEQLGMFRNLFIM